MPETADILRPMTDEDQDLVLAWRNAPAVRANMYTDHEISSQEHARWWRRVKTAEDKRYFVFEDNGLPRGVVSFSDISPRDRNAFWAFYSAPEARKGMGARMELLALNHAFGPLGLNKLCCEVLAFNAAVIKLHTKFGFEVEGVFREQHFKDDRYWDIHRLGLMQRDWLSRQHEMASMIRATQARYDAS